MAHQLGPPWREAPDSGGGTQRSVIVAFPSRRTVGVKYAPRDRRHWAHGSAQCLLRAAALRQPHPMTAGKIVEGQGLQREAGEVECLVGGVDGGEFPRGGQVE